jgi:hypothetical protein
MATINSRLGRVLQTVATGADPVIRALMVMRAAYGVHIQRTPPPETLRGWASRCVQASIDTNAGLVLDLVLMGLKLPTLQAQLAQTLAPFDAAADHRERLRVVGGVLLHEDVLAEMVLRFSGSADPEKVRRLQERVQESLDAHLAAWALEDLERDIEVLGQELENLGEALQH